MSFLNIKTLEMGLEEIGLCQGETTMMLLKHDN